MARGSVTWRYCSHSFQTSPAPEKSNPQNSESGPIMRVHSCGHVMIHMCICYFIALGGGLILGDLELIRESSVTS